MLPKWLKVIWEKCVCLHKSVWNPLAPLDWLRSLSPATLASWSNILSGNTHTNINNTYLHTACSLRWQGQRLTGSKKGWGEERRGMYGKDLNLSLNSTDLHNHFKYIKTLMFDTHFIWFAVYSDSVCVWLWVCKSIYPCLAAPLYVICVSSACVQVYVDMAVMDFSTELKKVFKWNQREVGGTGQIADANTDEIKSG